MISWHTDQWRQVLGGGLDRMHHALLLHGRPGLGKVLFADALAALLLCSRPAANAACGTCEACRWRLAGTHPDLRRIAADDETEEGDEAVARESRRGQATIGIDRIRDLDDFVFIGSHRAGRRIVQIVGAETMNPAAANSLLKILEEPPSTVYFILISDKNRSLMPTLRSRCQSVSFSVPAHADAVDWLRGQDLDRAAGNLLGLAGGAPLMLQRWAEEGKLPLMEQVRQLCAAPPADPIALAEAWSRLVGNQKGFSMENLVDLLQRWIADQAMTASGLPARYFPANRGNGMSPKAISHLLACGRELARIRRSARHPLNPQLFLEDLASRFLRGVQSI